MPERAEKAVFYRLAEPNLLRQTHILLDDTQILWYNYQLIY